jgi:enoyl-CoA hydratase
MIMTATPTYEHIKVHLADGIFTITISRPGVHNALHPPACREIGAALDLFESMPEASVAIVTGEGEKAFSAGFDLKYADAHPEVCQDPLIGSEITRRTNIGKPLIAAVSGVALGGGCELAMHCDIIVASESALFGQPEINLGVMPGAGGTQRLTRAVGKSLAMEMVLNGRTLAAREALAAGLVSRVVAVEAYLTEALRLAQEIAKRPPLALRLAKQAVLAAFDTGLSAGLLFERSLFYSLFATADQKEGMAAFLEKRPPGFVGQ